MKLSRFVTLIMLCETGQLNVCRPVSLYIQPSEFRPHKIAIQCHHHICLLSQRRLVVLDVINIIIRICSCDMISCCFRQYRRISVIILLCINPLISGSQQSVMFDVLEYEFHFNAAILKFHINYYCTRIFAFNPRIRIVGRLCRQQIRIVRILVCIKYFFHQNTVFRVVQVSFSLLVVFLLFYLYYI